MTLRGRLTTAFLVVVLGPVLLGAFFVAATVAANGQRQSATRLELAASTIRSSVGALCRQLRATGGAIAMITDPVRRSRAAGELVRQGLAVAVLLTDETGQQTFLTQGAPARPWTDCAGPAPSGAEPMRAIAARVQLRDEQGTAAGSVWIAELLDDAFVTRLAAATGTQVTLLRGSLDDTSVAQSTEPIHDRAGVLATAAGLRGDTIGETDGGRYVRRVTPSPGQPLPLVLSVPGSPPRSFYILLTAAVLGAGSLAVVAARQLAGSTTRPLMELAHAAGRVADGDLATPVPVRAPDEVGHLASTFNRMTESYARALRFSRDQLRGHLTVLGDTLASTHDLHRILRVILRTAVAASAARAGAVLLLDPAGGTLVSQCVEGLTEEETDGGEYPGDHEAIRVPLGTGLLGTVAATGEARRGRVSRDGPPLTDREPHCRTYVAVPFVVPGTEPGPTGADRPPVTQVVGVLALYDRIGADEFDDADLVTLQAFASHAAVAVENVRAHEEAQRLSLTDPLTGLWNYRYLKESINREVERAGRVFGVLALDLDRFKEVNDTYGHAAGDAVLAEFARRIRTEVREVDLAFRRGGEEFVVLLPGTDARGAAAVAERLRAAVRERPIVVRPRPGGRRLDAPVPISVTVSIGVAVYPEHAGSGQQVLDAADDALYAAKAAGRDAYRIAEPYRTPPLPTGVPMEPSLSVEAATPATGSPSGASFGPHPSRPGSGG